ncbi:MAG: IS1595 family transposase [Parasphingopyxis sp.]|uniref:IS1595 family transposase n=1 Tax=Parasphingopyxis sp. TaxID=1920299 RepID=UPI0032EC6583
MKKPKAPTLRQFQDRFPTEDSCLDHLMRTRYGERFDCEGCGKEVHYYRVQKRRSYACEHCGHQIYPTAGTPFHRTRTSLRDWFYVMFLFCASRNGVAAKEVERQIGVTYKTAWRMCHEIRKYMAQVDGDEPLGGPFKVVEIDETYVGGEARGRGTGYKANKTAVMAMLQRDGMVMSKVIPNRKKITLEGHIFHNVLLHTEIHTDDFVSYQDIGDFKGYWHHTVNHSIGEYVRGRVTTNTVEGFWAQVKRTVSGTHIHVSGKHLSKYLGEIEYRWNMRHRPHQTLDRLMASFA